MIKPYAIDEAAEGIFLAPDSVEIGRILTRHGSSDDLYDIHQGFIPGGPLIMTLIGSMGFAIGVAYRTAPSLALSLCFLFVAAMGVYRMLIQSRYQQTTVRRSQLMHMAEAAATLGKSPS